MLEVGEFALPAILDPRGDGRGRNFLAYGSFLELGVKRERRVELNREVIPEETVATHRGNFTPRHAAR